MILNTLVEYKEFMSKEKKMKENIVISNYEAIYYFLFNILFIIAFALQFPKTREMLIFSTMHYFYFCYKLRQSTDGILYS